MMLLAEHGHVISLCDDTAKGVAVCVRLLTLIRFQIDVHVASMIDVA